MTDSCFIEILKHEIVPAMGCTEPAASALAGAKARELIGKDEVAEVRISASRDMVKNAMGVSIPGCLLKGLSAAVALGIAGGDTARKLSILSDVDEKMVDYASTLEPVLELAGDVPSLYVCVSVKSKTGHEASVTISGEHDSFSKVVLDGKVLNEVTSCGKANGESDFFADVTLGDVLSFADNVKVEEIDFLKDAIKANFNIAKYGMSHCFGLQVGKTMAKDITGKPADINQAFQLGAAYAAAGSDARMCGCPMPVYINSGSGNQGLTVTVPVKTVGEYLGAGEEKILRAVCVSELVGLMLTEKKSRLSALCGAFTAAIGTACAYAYLFGGGAGAMDEVINIMVANLTGIICDGAKKTCALKIYSCLEAAAMAVRLAFNGQCPDDKCGIVGADSRESISHLSIISKEGMEGTDKTIYSIMLDKVNSGSGNSLC
ncbi:MAG: L-cysteine desulfidase family protein [Sphaerochaeta sp.]